jgi:hypothetical protein
MPSTSIKKNEPFLKHSKVVYGVFYSLFKEVLTSRWFYTVPVYQFYCHQFLILCLQYINVSTPANKTI